MSDINKELLYEVYRKKFGVQDFVSCSLRKEFNQMMLLKYEMMPYWFVLKLIEMGIEVNEEEEYF
jgi:hypothetical protein|tara:strand:- start:1026 stop:1220 length:195 start_codon:yes stop_codon:yes gene_type:complete